MNKIIVAKKIGNKEWRVSREDKKGTLSENSKQSPLEIRNAKVTSMNPALPAQDSSLIWKTLESHVDFLNNWLRPPLRKN